MTHTPIYLDYNATTPIDPEVFKAMLPYLQHHFGNPSSLHAYGQTARPALERARCEVASIIGARSDEIVFTGGGSEASNHAIKGAALAHMRRGTALRPQIVMSAIEHPATLEAARALRSLGFEVMKIGVDCDGIIRLSELARALEHPTLLVSIMHANNETGVLQPIEEVANLAHARGALVHVDAAQSAGKVRVDVGALGVDLLTLAGHKLYAPKGIGALFVRKGIDVEPLIHGAGQESGRRAGTENVAFSVGLGRACAIAQEHLAEASARMRALRDDLWAGLRAKLGDRITLNGHFERRLPNTLNVSFAGCIGALLLAATPEIAASTGSACHEGRVSISPVLAEMGLARERAEGAVRLSVGRYTTEEEIEAAISLLADRANALSASVSPPPDMR